MSVSLILTVAFFALMVVGYFYVVGKVWRGESHLDGSRPPEFWPFSLPLWRGVGRALPIQGMSVLLLIGGGVAGDVVGKQSQAYDVVMGIGALGLLGLFLLAFPITYFNRPRFLVPPHQRGDPGAVEEWRRERARRSPKGR